jgi:hypothetical protein
MWRERAVKLQRFLLRVAVSFAAVGFIVLLGSFDARSFGARDEKAAQPSYTAELPPGPMQAKATAACTECHEARILLQQRLSKPAWTKEVDKMTRWGALVDPSDRDALIDYLSANFSPDKPPYIPQKTSSTSGKSAK